MEWAGRSRPARSSKTPRLSLPVDANANAQHARRKNGADVVGGRAVLRALQCLDRVRVHDVEHVHRRDEPHRPEFDRTLDVDVEVLVIGQAILADVVEENGRDARAIGARWTLDRGLEWIALPRVLERREVHLARN